MSPELVAATLVSLQVALLSTVCIAPIGIGLAWLLARRRFRGRALVQTLVALPLVLPPVAVGVLLLSLLGKQGPLGALGLVFTPTGAAVAAGVMSFPLLVRTCESAFADVPRRYELVARTLGASGLGAFFRVTLPLARRGVAYGLLLAFSRGLGEFGATILVAGNIPGQTTTLSVGIWSLFEAGHDARAWAYIGVSLALAFGSVLVAEVWLSRRR